MFRELEFESTVWPPTLDSVLGRVREALPADALLLRWAVTAVHGHRLTVELIVSRL